MNLFLARVVFVVFAILLIVSFISIFNKKFRNKKIYIALPILLLTLIVAYNIDTRIPNKELKVEYSSIGELFKDKGDSMKSWVPEDCKGLVKLYSEGQVLNPYDSTNFVGDYESFSDECKDIVKDVYASEKKKQDERIEKYKEEELKKTEEFNAQYPNVTYVDVKDVNQAIEKAKNLVTSQINNNIQIKDNFKIIDASYNKMTIEVFDTEFTNGAAVAVQNIIFTAYQDAGLSRDSSSPKEITAIIKCGEGIREASWELGKAPVRKE
ncbi:hypothetical protein [Clostridium gasigenes]|uniref:Uncharacterized protein n=1 Tax=Clostridium gasigenes TaxID=94869 RepID=A0A1H0M8Z6_9CLOT|nr:hypothetical protein [Clostridium gasigenes]SDO76978.1 hypothetical protein SAMN04488529_101371 [Clostridium gasigenes]